MDTKRRGGALGLMTAVGILTGTIFMAPASATPVPGTSPALGPAVAAATPKTTYDKTSKAERHRVDRTKTPKPTWFNCSPLSPGAQCASVALPLDYDNPRGAKTEVAVLRLKAKDQKNRIGTLFLNPGGPGGSGVFMAATAPEFLSPQVLERFDIVGFDPRGVNFSDGVRCWNNLGTQQDALAGMDIPYPVTSKEKRAYAGSAMGFGKACSTRGKPLSASMSTAQVARDMDVLRRMVGDSKLSYLGFSYGSYLGTVYANMFPDRVRAVAIDGVLDPIAWAGTRTTAGIPQTQRIRSGEGTAKAIRGILKRCKKAGKDYCMLASAGDPEKTYRAILAELKAKPLAIEDEETGEVLISLNEPILTTLLLGEMYSPSGSSGVDMILSSVQELLTERTTGNNTPPPAPTSAPSSGSALGQKAQTARQSLLAKIRHFKTQEKAAARESARKASASGFAFPYDNSPDAFQAVMCSDGKNPSTARNWSRYAAAANIVAPGFGPLWTWSSAPCATSTWKAQDEDSYTGSFKHRTKNPVLVVGNYWDPATNYAGATKVARLMPNSRLLRSASWGHTAYGTSDCVTAAMDRYLLTRRVPAAGTRCIGDQQPFTEKLEEDFENQHRRSAPPRELPPVVPPLPGALPRS